MPVHVALVRAINVGGRSMSMAELREMLEELGLKNGRTLLQSGNAVFESPKTPAALEAMLEKAAEKRFGLVTEFFVRTAGEWDDVIAANPFAREAKNDPSHLLVMPLKAAPNSAGVEALRVSIKGRERVAIEGRCAYLVYPDGIGRSKLTNAVVESRLKTRGTARNWNTVQKLAALVAAGSLLLGCFERTTASFEVRHPGAVALEAPDGRPVLPAQQPGTARTEILAHSVEHALFTSTPYDVLAEREADGSIHVSCPTCASAFGHGIVAPPPVVGSDGWAAPVSIDDVLPSSDALRLHEHACFVQGKECRASADALLRVPWDDAILARVHTEPVRWVSVIGIAGGAPVVLAGALDYALSPRDAPHGEAALALGAVGLALVGWGVWYLLAPASDENLSPTDAAAR